MPLHLDFSPQPDNRVRSRKSAGEDNSLPYRVLSGGLLVLILAVAWLIFVEVG